MLTLTDVFFHLQRQLFLALEEELDSLSALDEQFCQVVSMLNLGPLMRRFAWVGNGCPPRQRTWLFHAYLAKSVYQFPTTAALIAALKAQPRLRQLCGWDSAGNIRSESTFSRAFAAFAQ
ncbi:MAG: transposase [Verrucomicrobia bacterium]|nr:transposase [Verrucomicrobiota bacterium]